MTAKKRFHYYPKSQMIVDVFTGKRYFGHDAICKLLNILYEENEQLKKELLFFYDVANCECSTNWRKDMEKGCKRFFNCTYEEAKEKYGDYDGMWWEIND